MAEDNNITEQDQSDDWSQALEEQAIETDQQLQAEPEQLEQAKLENLQAEDTMADEDTNLSAILDIPVSLSVVIGQTKISIRNLLQLNQGSVVELDRLAGEPLDVMVNNTLVANGEVVVVNEKYGIRLTDVVSKHDRVKQL
ncbi:MAG: flagellar motor switch protein FliN [Gammaproteobacteria bacterium]|nr:flagellar motor switch protein FliN [Gammaproteobacteria bacterium]